MTWACMLTQQQWAQHLKRIQFVLVSFQQIVWNSLPLSSLICNNPVKELGRDVSVSKRTFERSSDRVTSCGHMTTARALIMWPLNAICSHSFPESVTVSAALRRSSGGWRGGKAAALIQGVGWRLTGITNAVDFIRSNQFGTNSLRDSVFLRFFKSFVVENPDSMSCDHDKQIYTSVDRL